MRLVSKHTPVLYFVLTVFVSFTNTGRGEQALEIVNVMIKKMFRIEVKYWNHVVSVYADKKQLDKALEVLVVVVLLRYSGLLMLLV